MSTSPTLARCSFVVVSLVLLAGCKSGSSAKAGAAASAGGSAAGTAAPAGASGAAAPVAVASGHPAVTCQQLTFAQVQPFMGETITKVAVTLESAADDFSGQQCLWTSAGDDTIQVFVVKGPGAAASYAQEVANETDGAIDVPGIGDKASRDKGGAEVNAVKGDVYCSTGVDNGLPAIATLETAANGTTNIGEDLYQDAAIAVGTLCNRIFGSGNTTPDLSKLIAAAAAASGVAKASASASNAAASAFGNSPAPASSPVPGSAAPVSPAAS